MDLLQIPVADAKAGPQLEHDMANIAPVHEISQEEIGREKRVVPNVYPEVVRHLPGNSQKEVLPTLTGGLALPPEVANRHVHERLYSLTFYGGTATGYSLLNMCLFTIAHRSLDAGTRLVVIPGTLQYIALVSAGVTLVAVPVLFLGRRLSVVKAALCVQLVCYGVVFMAAFVEIMSNFAYFFVGVGLLAFIAACFFLWANSVRKDIGDLPEL